MFGPIGNGVQLALGITRQVRALRQVLAQQIIGILVGPALPGAVRIGTEDLDREAVCEPFVVRPLVALIGGECVPQRGRHVPEFLGEAPSRTRRIRVFQPGHDHQTGRSLHQGADGRPVTRTFASVAFPVGRGTIRVATSAGRSATDIILGIWPRRSAPRTTRLVRLTQDRQQFRSPGPSRQAVQHHRDGLG